MLKCYCASFLTISKNFQYTSQKKWGKIKWRGRTQGSLLRKERLLRRDPVARFWGTAVQPPSEQITEFVGCARIQQGGRCRFQFWDPRR